MRALYFFVIFSFTLLANPSGLEVIKGNASSHGGKSLTITTSDGAVLHWKTFSIAEGETTTFIQPSESSWVLNRVTGNVASEILGTLQANGQLALLNPHGILFGAGATVDVGGIIASTLGEGSVINKGAIHARSGDVILMGKKVECSGTIEVLGKAAVHGEDNPYALAIQFKRPKEGTILQEVNGRILLLSDEETFVGKEGSLISKEIGLISKGTTTFLGSAKVDDGYLEISGRKGFHLGGDIDRTGGHLILDPESDITISTACPYNYSYKDGMPEADFSNISITQLIQEIEKGPVTITTAFQGEGGGDGSIYIKSDVSHCYNSPYPLIFNCSGAGGINVEGTLKNHGNGSIILNSNSIFLSGQLEGRLIETQGYLTGSGNLFANTIHIYSENGGFISGKIIADGGPLTWLGGGTLLLKGGEIGNIGNESLILQGLENITLQNQSRLTTLNSNLIISDLTGSLSIENSTLRSCGLLSISGGMGSLHIYEGVLESTNQLNIYLGRFLHCHDGIISSHHPLSLTIGHDIILTENSLITSTSGISLNTKGNLLLADQSMIKGEELSMVVSESAYLFSDSQIQGQKGSLSLTTGESLTIDGKNAHITSAQTTIHSGHTISLECQSQISSTQGTTSITAGKGLHLFEQGKITATGGNLELFVPGGNLRLSGHSSLHSTTHGSNLFIGNSFIMEHFASFESIGEEGTVIVVDRLKQGGGVVLGVNASIKTGNSPLKLFTAAPRYNTLYGTLNGHRYTSQMPLYLTTNQDHWGINYPNVFFAEPFTIFHKENGLIQTNIGLINQKTFIRHLVNYIGPFTSELFRDLHPYDEYTRESINFTDNEQPYFIRKRAKK